jgi:hypothetical protein
MASSSSWRACSGGAPGGSAGGVVSNQGPRDRSRSPSSTSHRPSRFQTTCEATVQRKIIGFHQDEAQDWVADLACGHQQHVRHTPPWLHRPWVVSPVGRCSRLGSTVDCKHCDHHAQTSAPGRSSPLLLWQSHRELSAPQTSTPRVAWRFCTSTDHTAACLRKVVKKLALAVLLSYPVVADLRDVGICP